MCCAVCHKIDLFAKDYRDTGYAANVRQKNKTSWKVEQCPRRSPKKKITNKYKLFWPWLRNEASAKVLFPPLTILTSPCWILFLKLCNSDYFSVFLLDLLLCNPGPLQQHLHHPPPGDPVLCRPTFSWADALWKCFTLMQSNRQNICVSYYYFVIHFHLMSLYSNTHSLVVCMYRLLYPVFTLEK